MEKHLHFRQTLPLKEIAIRRVTISLWFGTLDFIPMICDEQRNAMEDMVKHKVSKLVLPKSLKKQILHLVKPIGSDILDWILQHENIFNEGYRYFHLRALLQWTWLCAIDYRKTAEELIRLEMFDIWYRFHLACFYCLEDKIPLLWEKLHEYDKDYYEDKFRDRGDSQILSYWIGVLRRDGSDLEQILRERPSSLYKEGLKYCARKGNKAATEYFLKKPGNEERGALFLAVDTVIHERLTRYFRTRLDFTDKKLADVFGYLLSLMTPEEQMKVFKKHPFKVLSCFLVWPFQYLFLDITDIYWSFFPESSYDWLLSTLHKSIQVSGYYFPKLFQEFFLRSPVSFKKLFADEECRSGSFISEFFIHLDPETILVVFKNIDAKDRLRLVLSEPIFELLFRNDVILRERWDIVALCIRDAAPSKEDRERWKIYIKERVARVLRVNWETHNMRRLFEILDEMDGNTAGKGSAEGETLAKVQKLQH